MDEALAAGRAVGVEVIPSVELSCDVAEGELHMLGYFADHADAAFQAELSRLREGRVGRAQAMVRKLNTLGYPITFERVQELAGDGAIGRPHVAQALIEARLVQNKGEAFERLIGRGGAAYVERAQAAAGRRLPLDPARRRPARLRPPLHRPGQRPGAGADAGGVVAAGPGGGRPGRPGGLLPQLHPVLIERLLRLSRQYGLLVTGGSDFHGEGVAGAPLAGVYVPPKCLAALKSSPSAGRAEQRGNHATQELN